MGLSLIAVTLIALPLAVMRKVLVLRCGGKFSVKSKGDGAAINSGTVDVQRQFRAFGSVGDGQVGDRGKIVARGILDHA